ncbi:MAG: hypothetical protein L0312_24660 [Acidobacteria bacterium]|nr:hypothetical protein [Acidobacteriota bacterium]
MAELYHAFPDPVQDKLLGLILALGAEVWVLKDRFTLLEKALSARGIQVSEIINELANQPERVPEMERDREAFMERFLRILTQEVK